MFRVPLPSRVLYFSVTTLWIVLSTQQVVTSDQTLGCRAVLLGVRSGTTSDHHPARCVGHRPGSAWCLQYNVNVDASVDVIQTGRAEGGVHPGHLREGDHLKDPGVDGRKILKCIFGKWNGGMDWIGLAQETGQVAGCCECGNEALGCIRCGEFLD